MDLKDALGPLKQSFYNDISKGGHLPMPTLGTPEILDEMTLE
jgi:hypothetical protein